MDYPTRDARPAAPDRRDRRLARAREALDRLLARLPDDFTGAATLRLALKQGGVMGAEVETKEPA